MSHAPHPLQETFIEVDAIYIAKKTSIAYGMDPYSADLVSCEVDLKHRIMTIRIGDNSIHDMFWEVNMKTGQITQCEPMLNNDK